MKVNGLVRSHDTDRGALVKTRTTIAALLLALSVSACASSKKLDTFDLSSASPDVSSPKKQGRQILIAAPSALKALDGENIVVRSGPNSISFLKGAQWADRLPNIVQSRLVQAFESTGRLGGVGRPGEGLAIDYQVISDIRTFNINVSSGRIAIVEIAIKILNDKNGTVRAVRVFRATSPVSGEGNASYIAALDRAFDSAASDIVTWTLSVI
ncbi:ABC-type transport auxiliary lipoprotein family protein [Phyllobacterium zundukense]|jgi:cholesterol transport system auxiliary component|uniref:ABC-type transport auxiliary lipoprotein family protein n=1 Tax=Phyllobacterium zundukense TaxID=1867719 RepID=A0ACD4D1Y9_9HYPH|nr:ABC-type transport auxiliary lipoprotein family protein [Phyllobacterium zundukense]UXN59836.1 ABC-type transport auxiliary lipoprotein family protein [Phyllobacterium zundukense]